MRRRKECTGVSVDEEHEEVEEQEEGDEEEEKKEGEFLTTYLDDQSQNCQHMPCFFPLH